MANKKKSANKKAGEDSAADTTNIPGTQQADDLDVKELIFIEAKINGDMCNYQYKENTGERKGFKHKCTGIGIVSSDLQFAFAKLNVHLACLDDVFKRSGKEFDAIETMHGDDYTLLYAVHGFTIKGEGENLQVSLLGTKQIDSAPERADITTPKILLYKYSGYKWWLELKHHIEIVMAEVEEYHHGKFTLPEPEEEANPNQNSLFDALEDAEGGGKQ